MKKKKQYQYTSIFRKKKVVFRAESIPLLATSVLAFNRKNNIKPKTVDGVTAEVTKMHRIVESNISTKNPKKKRSGISLSSAFAAAKALVNYAKGDTVDQKEIDRRIKICLKCPSMTQASNCMSCGGSRMATNIVTSVKRIFGKNLRFPAKIAKSYCGVCGCSLSLIIPTKMEGFTEEMFKKKGRPSNCWLTK